MAKYRLTYPLLALALVVAASCSQDEPDCAPDNPEGRQIIFRTDIRTEIPDIIPAATNRAEILERTLPYFQVTAFNPADLRCLTEGVLNPHFNNERINVEPSVTSYSSDRCEWPEQGREADQLTFFAFYPELYAGAKLSNSSSTSKFHYSIDGFRVNSDIASQVDFVTAYATGNMADDMFRGINLTFAHQLSRIEVNAWSANKSCDIEIAGIRLGGVGVEGTFDFATTETGGAWNAPATKHGIVEYIFQSGDRIVSLPNKRSGASTTTAAGAVSIMGPKTGDYNSCAMLIPSSYSEWDAAYDGRNALNNTYFSVLLRITDAPPTSGIDPADPQRYPYRDLSQGADAFKVPVIYFAVDKATGSIIKRLYKKENFYTTDANSNAAYTLPAGAEIKEFGWAALPVTAEWAPGKIYTYTLNYTSGIGLLDPEVDTTSPQAGDPVISDKVAITYTVKDWQAGGGSEFVVPGS